MPDEEGNIEAEESLQWLINKDVAFDKGMAIKVENPENEYTKIVVIGLVEDTADSSTEKLLNLFDDHTFTEGLALMNVGENTNNTSEKGTSYYSLDKDFERYYDMFSEPELNQDNRETDLNRLRNGIGIEDENLDCLINRNNTHISDGLSVGNTLFPGTVGLFMEDMLSNILNHDNRERIREYFNDFVSGRGMLPTIRIGNQPYGFHLSSSLHRFEMIADDDIANDGSVYGYSALINESTSEELILNIPDTSGDPQVDETTSFVNVDFDSISDKVLRRRFESRMKEVLIFLDKEWRKLAQDNAMNVYPRNMIHFKNDSNNFNESWNSQDHFMEILGLHAHSLTTYARYMINAGTHGHLAITGVGDQYQQNFSNWADQLSPAHNAKWMEFLSGMDQTDWLLSAFNPVIDAQTISNGFYAYRGDLKNEPLHPNDMIDPENFAKNISRTRIFGMAGVTEMARNFKEVIHDLVNNNLPSVGDPGHYTNYIDFLINTNPAQIFAENNLSALPSGSLLFQTLRTSFLAKYRDISARIFVREGLADWNSMMNIGSPEESISSGISQELFGSNTQSNFQPPHYNSGYFTNQVWTMTRWNLLFDYIKGEQIVDLFGSICSPSSYTDQHSWASREYFWKLFNYDHSNYSDQNDIVVNGISYSFTNVKDFLYPELASYLLSNFNYDSNALVHYLRPVTPEPSSDLYETFQINTEDTEVESNAKTMADYLFNHGNVDASVKNQHQDLLNELEDYKSKAAVLGQMSEEDLQRAYYETLDLTSYRLDAWINGLYAKRLKMMRDGKFLTEDEITEHVEDDGRPAPSGPVNKDCFLGAYGYVENLTRSNEDDLNSGQLQDASAEAIPDEFADIENLQMDTASDGYIIAPSIHHGITAAVLRSAYLSSRVLENSAVHDQLNIRLSSRRVRKALKLIEGVKSGRDLGELLGYELERGLHEQSKNTGIELDKYIYGLRKKFPISVARENDSLDGELLSDIGDLRSGVVLDGLKLADHIIAYTQSDSNLSVNDSIYSHYTGTSDNYNHFDLDHENNEVPDFSNPDQVDDYKLFTFEIDQMISSLDALSDLIVSEGVFQMVMGNNARTNAVMSMMSGAKTLIDPEIIDTPKRENRFDNRVVLSMDTVASLEEGIPVNWPSEALGKMAELEPSLNKWIGEKIGDPSLIVFDFKYRITEEEPWSETEQFSLADIGFHPLDLLLNFGKNPFQNSSFICNRTKILKKQGNAGLPYTTEFEFIFENSQTNSDQIRLYEFAPYLESILELVLKSNALTAQNMQYNSEENDSLGIDFDQINARLSLTRNSILELLLDIQEGNDTSIDENYDVGDLSQRSPTELIELLNQMSAFGFGGAIPISGNENADQIEIEVDDNTSTIYDPKLKEDLIDSLTSFALILHNRFMNAQKKIAEFSNQDEETPKWQIFSEIAQIYFGKQFRLLPIFNVGNQDELNLATSEQAQEQLFLNKEADEEILTWMHSLNHVRENIQSLSNIGLFSDVLGLDETLFKAAQIPFLENDFWLGCEFPEGAEFEAKTNIVIQGEVNSQMCGLLVDEWSEGIPEDRINGSIAYHLDQPGAEAPQTILMAIPAKRQANWDLDDLLYSIVETVDMAKYRSLEPKHIMNAVGLSKMFPANAADAFPATVPSTDEETNGGIRASFDYYKNSN